MSVNERKAPRQLSGANKQISKLKTGTLYCHSLHNSSLTKLSHAWHVQLKQLYFFHFCFFVIRVNVPHCQPSLFIFRVLPGCKENKFSGFFGQALTMIYQPENQSHQLPKSSSLTVLTRVTPEKTSKRKIRRFKASQCQKFSVNKFMSFRCQEDVVNENIRYPRQNQFKSLLKCFGNPHISHNLY